MRASKREGEVQRSLISVSRSDYIPSSNLRLHCGLAAAPNLASIRSQLLITSANSFLAVFVLSRLPIESVTHSRVCFTIRPDLDSRRSFVLARSLLTVLVAMASSSSNVVGVHYRVGKKIGEGSFGVIFEGTNLLNNQQVAIKFV